MKISVDEMKSEKFTPIRLKIDIDTPEDAELFIFILQGCRSYPAQEARLKEKAERAMVHLTTAVCCSGHKL